VRISRQYFHANHIDSLCFPSSTENKDETPHYAYCIACINWYTAWYLLMYPTNCMEQCSSRKPNNRSAGHELEDSSICSHRPATKTGALCNGFATYSVLRWGVDFPRPTLKKWDHLLSIGRRSTCGGRRLQPQPEEAQ
jgi:hypothetical protein